MSCFVGLQSYLWPMHVFFWFGIHFGPTGHKQTTGSHRPDVLLGGRVIFCVFVPTYSLLQLSVFFLRFPSDFMMRPVYLLVF